MVNKYFVVFLVVFGVVNQIEAKPKNRKLADYIVPCKRNDPNLNECLVENGNKAIKTIVNGDASRKIRILNPLTIDSVVLQPSPDLKLDLTGVVIQGLENTRILKATWGFEKKVINAKLLVPRAEINGEYVVDGKILILPINGNGHGNLTFENVEFDNEIYYELEERNGKEYLKMTEHTLKHKPQRVYYDLSNLFNGNKQLGDEMNRFLNENWEEIDKELSGSVIEVIKTLAREILENSLKNVPFDEVFLP